ncbi:hypothetical protein EDB81DRAFT_934469 [Dactylonectria macrodidyma]|uniref:DUF7730 domain-containing protein n=1 Tax=Dactylonectria macrodidyma TaxID=307937 RepID=A0A9P9EWA8_9HYPO|nr:hypothetical protein EDB81DRAFT_934469 [Dactylonectria macrodidyma]
MDTNLQSGHSQAPSAFFTKLNPDVRRLVYLQAFGNRRLHVGMDLSVGPASQKLQKQKWFENWWHYVCQKHCTSFPHYGCNDDDSPHLTGTNFLRTCKQGLEEATPVLYGTNTFCFKGYHVLFHFQQKTYPYFGFIKNIDCVLEHMAKVKPFKTAETESLQAFKDLVLVMRALPAISIVTLRLRIAPGRHRYMRVGEQLLYCSVIADLLYELQHVDVYLLLHLVLPAFLQPLVESNILKGLTIGVESIEFSDSNTGCASDELESSDDSSEFYDMFDDID